MPERLQRRRQKGWRMPEGAVYVGRPTRWGNPFRIGRPGDACDPFGPFLAVGMGYRGDRAGCHRASVAAHRLWLTQGRSPGLRWGAKTVWDIDPGEPPSFGAIREALAGRALVCWCRLDQPCHADMLLAIANGTACPGGLACPPVAPIVRRTAA